MKYLIVLEGNGECAAYDSQAVAEGEARRLSVKAGAHFIAVPSRENPAAPQLLDACRELLTIIRQSTRAETQRHSAAILRDAEAAIAAAEGR